MSRRRRRGRGNDGVAIIGMACRFPGAPDLVAFAENLLAGVDSTTPVPTDRWNPATFFDPAPDRVKTHRGGYLAEPIPFDPGRQGVMPRAVEGGEPEQFLILDTARAALRDAGLPDGPADGRRAEVVVARGNYFNRGNLTRLSHGRILAQTLAILESLHPEWTDADRHAVRADLQASLPPFEAATIPGQLTNATAGRVADRLDLLGASYVVDAASASALVALDLAARSLKERRADLALVGAVYLEADVDFPLVFDRLGALSQTGHARPFTAGADGLISGEGVGVVVLKRLADAEAAGDRIYAVVRGVGIASDGRGAGLAAPSARGHARAIRRAYRASRVEPAQVALIEGHGLGLPAADRAEIRALRATFPPIASGRRALGAVSALIGHAMPAAGMAGLIKASLALHHRVIPPSTPADNPHPALLRPDSPVHLNDRVRPWVHGATDHPRTAGVNAFGFAGINAHAVLQAHPSSDRPDAPGALTTWDTEAFCLGGRDRADLAHQAQTLINQLAQHPSVSAKDLAFTLNSDLNPDHPARLGLVAKSAAELAERLDGAVQRLLDPACRSIRDSRGIYFWDRGDNPEPPPVAFLFPGEGSQYPGMLGDLAAHFPEVRAMLDTADRLARRSGSRADDPDAPWPSEILYGRGGNGAGLWSAEVAVNVVLSAEWALYQILRRLGLRPDAVLGHSSGEFLALAAAGVLAMDQAFEDGLAALASLFGRLETTGAMPAAQLVAVATDRAKVEAAIAATGQTAAVEVAMDNCPHQVVLAGEPASVDAVVARLRERGTLCEVLPFARAYHTPSFAPSVGPIRDFFGSIPIRPPTVPLYSCVDGQRMPADPAAIEALAVKQWTRCVAFRPAVEAMHAAGIRVFVDVGARGNLAGFVEDTLRGRPSFAIGANLPRRSGMTQLNHLVAALHAQGISLDPGHLYARRRPVRLDLANAPEPDRPIPALAVGFPTMRLSDDLRARLQARPTPDLTPKPPPAPAPIPPANGHHHEPIRLDLDDDPAPASTDSADPATAILLDFQRTMTDFLATQESVIGSFLDGGRGEDSLATNGDGNGWHPVAVAEAPADPIASAWAGDLVAFDPGRSSVALVTLDPADDPVAEHHTLGGRRISAIHPDWRGLPVLPFSVMAEMLAQAAGRLVPEGWALVMLRDVVAHKWIRYEDDGPVTLEVRAEVVGGSAPDQAVVRVAIGNRGTSQFPRTAEPAVFTGEVVFAAEPLAPVVAPGAPPLELPRPCRFTAASIYGDQWLFHGPALQAVAAIGPIVPNGIAGELVVLPRGPLFRDPGDAGSLWTDPIILDNFTHLLGGWGLDELAEAGDVIFPLRMEALTIHGEPPADGSRVSCRVVVEVVERHRVRVRADIDRPDGTTWMAIRGWEDWRFHWPGRYRDSFRHPDRALIGEPLDLAGVAPEVAAAVWLEPPDDMGRPVWRDVLEHVQLGPAERRAYLALPGPDHRRTHRLWGRIAAKEAARRVELARGLPPSFPADLVVTPDPQGQPILAGGSRFGLDQTRISIGHVDGVAVALAVADPDACPGIDVEAVMDRSPGFAEVAFSKLERSLLECRYPQESTRSVALARFWAVKEAVAKATGYGFVVGPGGVEVVALGPPDDRDPDGLICGVEIRGELASLCPGLAGRTIRVTSTRRGDFVWAWTLGETWHR